MFAEIFDTIPSIAFVVVPTAVILFLWAFRHKPYVRGRPSAKDKIIVTPKTAEIVTYGACNHAGPKAYEVDLWGTRLRSQENGWKEGLCPTCMIAHARKTVIRCVRCGQPILPGVAVALYQDGARRDVATKTASGMFIGCLQPPCAHGGVLYAGRWDGEEIVPAFPEGRTMYAHACDHLGTCCADLAERSKKEP